VKLLQDLLNSRKTHDELIEAVDPGLIAILSSLGLKALYDLNEYLKSHHGSIPGPAVKAAVEELLAKKGKV